MTEERHPVGWTTQQFPSAFSCCGLRGVCPSLLAESISSPEEEDDEEDAAVLSPQQLGEERRRQRRWRQPGQTIRHGEGAVAATQVVTTPDKGARAWTRAQGGRRRLGSTRG